MIVHFKKAHRSTILAVVAILFALTLVGGLSSGPKSWAAEATATLHLESVKVSSLSGNRVQIELLMSGSAPHVNSFTIDDPARISLDFPNTASDVAKKNQEVDLGMVRSINVVQGSGRTRVVLNLAKMVPYETHVDGNRFVLVVAGNDSMAATPHAMTASGAAAYRLEGVDFRRGPDGEGRILVNLSDPSTPVNLREEGGKIMVDFTDTTLPKELERQLDVTDFATPVTTIDTFKMGNDVRMVISASGNYEHLAYQAERQFAVEVKPITKGKQDTGGREEVGYTGEKLSLNFQDIEVRAALQIIADFTGLNVVVSDSVKGNISVRLKDVPWDQALDIILKTKGLGMRKMGNVMLIAPSDEIAAREKQELESQKQVTELEPLHSELIQVNYAKAADFAALLRSKGTSSATTSPTLLSARGTVTVDDRTNTLLVQDIASRLADIRRILAELDIPIRQVLIESRIVVANDDYSRQLGAEFGVTGVRNGSKNTIITSGDTTATNTIATSGAPYSVTTPNLNDGLNVNLPVASPDGSIGLAILGAHYLVDLELTALQSENRGEVISSPRVITANQKEALIEQGVEIPYQQASSSGATAVSFQNAVLSLKVKPQITPDNRIMMDLDVTNDTVGTVFQGVPSINTQQVTSQVLVEDGQTVVLGGIYQRTTADNVSQVPFLGDIPVLGALFRTTDKEDQKNELLIFITPKILKEGLNEH